MTYLSGIVLGAVEGLTEFLPISSSGHLIIARELFGFSSDNGLAVDAVLQLGTILAVVIYFWADLWQLAVAFFRMILGKAVEAKEKTLLTAIILGTIPAVVLGLALEKEMDTMFRSAFLVACTLLAGSVLMWFAEKVNHESRITNTDSALTVRRGFIIGLFQTLALVPGVSRSGATISGGLILGLTREEATRYSFQLAFPVIAGGGLKKLYDLIKHHELAAMGPELALGSLVAFAVGYFCIAFLIKYLKTHTLKAFIWYRVALACVVFGFLAAK